jgi:hypothetical protein
MLKLLFTCLLGAVVLCPFSSAQNANPGTADKPTEHVLGPITRVDSTAHTITVKDDKSATEYTVQVGATRTLLKVAPGAKDLKSATRISPDDLATGDRVDVRGFKGDAADSIAARSVVLMSARDLLQKHQSDLAAWQNSVNGTVNSVDTLSGTINITSKTPGGPKPLVVHAPATVEFTRYAPDNPKVPAPSQIAEIQSGDQLRIIGQQSDDGSAITAQKIFSGSFRTIAGTVSALSPDGKKITLKDLQTKRAVDVVLTTDSVIRKLPPEMATRLARRFNPSLAATTPGSGAAGNQQPPAPAPAQTEGPSGGGMRGGRGGDLSQLLSHVPEINISELKAGDAVVVSGASGTDKSQLIASSIIAGVEPIFQAAPVRQGQSLGEWSLDMTVPAQ